MAYGLLPDEPAFDYQGDRIYFNNIEAERLFHSGGGCNSTTNAGVFYAHGYSSSRTHDYSHIGFRSAYVKL